MKNQLINKDFLTVVFTAIVMVVVAYLPEFQSQQETLITALVVLAGLALGSNRLDDLIRIFGNRAFVQAGLDVAERLSGYDIDDKTEGQIVDKVTEVAEVFVPFKDQKKRVKGGPIPDGSHYLVGD